MPRTFKYIFVIAAITAFWITFAMVAVSSNSTVTVSIALK